MVLETTKGNRLHIGFFGRCNAGKSTLINTLTEQQISLVSPIAGTTTDPVSKGMELLPLGPVMIVDTAGIDDTSELGLLRVDKTKQVLSTMDLAVYMMRTDVEPIPEDIEWLQQLESRHIPTLVVINEVKGCKGSDFIKSHGELQPYTSQVIVADVSDSTSRMTLLEALSKLRPVDEEVQSLLGGYIEEKNVFVLVCPIDESAPKGRIILPQVQMIREILDHHGMAMVCQVEELATTLQQLQKSPKLVITDSQAFEAVSQTVPKDIALTSFSILMARFKGKLKDLVAGVHAIEQLRAGSHVLISEGCTHRQQCEDIGTVKIPRWLTAKGYTDLQLEWTSGGHFPHDVSKYDVIIHCGGCMLTRREVLRRIDVATVQGVPIVNYGVLIASLHGILQRAIQPFEHELE